MAGGQCGGRGVTDLDRYKPYADRHYAPDWDTSDRPSFNTVTDEQRANFIAYCLRQLDELDRRVAETLTLDQTDHPGRSRHWHPDLMIQRMWYAGADERHQHARFLEQIGMTPDQYEKARRQMDDRMARADEDGFAADPRTGPPVRDPAERAADGSAMAAIDMWKLRQVIFPRVWGRKNRERAPKAEDIASQRHSVPASAIAARYENDRLARR
jgi:hypothetical protein